MFGRRGDLCAMLAILVAGIVGVIPAGLARAGDAGVTLQTSEGGYAGTQSLTKPITDNLKASVNSGQRSEIAPVLRQLKDGDVLVLAMHSNPEKFGLGSEVVEWKDFWRTFGVDKPPRLSAVIMGGCMVKYIGKDDVEPITEAQTTALRDIFKAEAVFTPRGAVHKNVAINDTNGLLGSLLGGKKLADLNLQGRWQYSVASKWKKPDGTLKDITLADLRRGGVTEQEAYDAGVEAGKSPYDVSSGYDKYNDNEVTAKAFRRGFLKGRELRP